MDNKKWFQVSLESGMLSNMEKKSRKTTLWFATVFATFLTLGCLFVDLTVCVKCQAIIKMVYFYVIYYLTVCNPETSAVDIETRTLISV